MIRFARYSIREYENLQYQYLQLLQLIELNQDLILKREKDVNKDILKADNLENNFNLKKDTIQTFIKNKNENEASHNNLKFYLKIFSFVLLIITIGLLLFKKTN